MKKLATLTLAATLLLSACGGSDDDASTTTTAADSTAGDEASTPSAPPATTTEASDAEADYELTDEEPPPFVLLGADREFVKGYVMPNGRILWVDEKSGIGRIIANPDEVLADQATCEYLFGMEDSDWFDWAEDIPNFEGPVCHPYSVNEDL
jgi:hypothetical protein